MNQNPDYFEGILQLRNPSDEAINFVENQFKLRNSKKSEGLEKSKNFQKNNEKVWIAKQVNLKTGIDLYVSSNKFLMQLGKKLKKSFKGKLILSRKLHTRNHLTSKNVYRLTVCFRFEEKED